MNEGKFAVAVKCIVESKKGILVLKKTNNEAINDKGNNLYDLPGGRVEYGEELNQAVIREINEETGLTIQNDVTLIDAKSIIRDDGLNLFILYYRCFSNCSVIKLSAEHLEYDWISEDEIKKHRSIPNWIKELF